MSQMVRAFRIRRRLKQISERAATVRSRQVNSVAPARFALLSKINLDIQKREDPKRYV